MAAILSWYASNVALLIANKYLLSTTGFRQPVFLTLCHMVACLMIGGVYMAATGTAKALRRQALGRVAVLTSIFCVTVVGGNASLRFLPVSFTQAIGATTPLFTALFALLLQGTREDLLTYATLLPIMGGIAIASGGEPLFNLLGFAICIGATAGRALKSVVQAIIMADPCDRLDPMCLLTYMSAIATPMLVAATCVLEPGAWSAAMTMAAARPNFVWLLAGSSTLAYLVNLCNFIVTKCTSPLTLQVLGNFKGVVAAVVSVFVFVNPVTLAGFLGYVVTVGGVFLYSWAKRRAHMLRVAGERQRTDIEVASDQKQLLPALAQEHERINSGDAHVELHIVAAGPAPAQAHPGGHASSSSSSLAHAHAKAAMSPALGVSSRTLSPRVFADRAAAATVAPSPLHLTSTNYEPKHDEDPSTVLAPFPSLQVLLNDRAAPAHVHAA